MSGVSDMAVARNDLARRIAQHDGETGLEAPFNRLSAILADLREAITRIRMQRIETLFSGFPRMVRDLSHELGKQVMVEIESGDVEIDREMIEVVRDPLVHLIRNAVDHGIETPAERQAAGKREIGMLQISARQTGSEIRIGIVDDGKGIDGDKLVEKAIAAGILTAEEAKLLTMRERNALICEPGLSTAKEVTSVSGRGVGMDVVRANIEKIGGSLLIDSTPGSGTRMMLNVPLTLSIVPSLTIGVGRQTFAIPRSYVEEIVRASSEEMDRALIGGREFITVRGQRIACVGLDEILGVESTCPREARLYVLIRLVGGDLFGLAVDAIHNHEELVVKPIAPVLMACGFYVGTTQLDDGSPVPMLDVSGVARSAGMIREVKDRSLRRELRHERAEERELVPALMFRGFDGAERAVEMDSVRRIEKLAVASLRTGPDGTAQAVIEGRIVPLSGLGGFKPEGEEINLFRVGEPGDERAYAYAEIVDLCEFDPAEVVVAEGNAGQRLALIDGRPVELFDAASLMAASLHGGGLTMDRSLLLVSIADERAAIASEIIRSVVELDRITPVPRAPEHIAGLAALRSRAMTVVDCRRALELPEAAETVALAVVVELDEFLYALVVDAVEEVVAFDTEPSEIRADLLPGWARAALGMVETSAGPALVLDPAKLIEGPAKRKAA